jgi:DeoR/GlpR family transcriptional regulator of sugar metabolism
LNTEDRYALILERLMVDGHIETATLTPMLGVSDMTIRRDLMRLEEDGALRRTRGGATRASGAYEPPFAVRSRLKSPAKAAIARAVVSHIRDGETVVLDGGTTGLAVAQQLVSKLATVCPLSLRAATVLADSSTLRVLVPGGMVRPGEQSFIGADAVQTINSHAFDTFIMTASGVATHAGITEWNEDDAAVKRAALASAGRCIVACDSSKFGQAAFARVAAITEVEIIITDNGVDPVMRRELEELGSRVEIARPLTEWLSVAAPEGEVTADMSA